MLEHELPRLATQSYLDANKIRIMRISPSMDRLHGHEFFELAYVMHGSAIHQLGSGASRVSEGDYFIVDFGSFHRYLETQEFLIVNCLFAPEYVDRVLVNCPSLSALLSNEMMRFDAAPMGSPSADRTYRDRDGHIRRLVEEMEREYQEQSAGYLEMIRCHLMEILVRTVRSAAETERSKDHHPAVAAMAQSLYEHYAEPLSLEAFSASLGYTPQYLSCLFHKETGMSLSAYLQRLRVEKSCRMLAETRLGVSKIAQEVGYCDLKHFNAVFKRYMGLTPREFRARSAAT